MKPYVSVLFVSLLSAAGLAPAQNGGPQPDPAATSSQSAPADEARASPRGIVEAPQPGNSMESAGASGSSGTSGNSGGGISGGNDQSGTDTQTGVMTDRGISRKWSGLGSTGGGTGTGTSSGTTASDPGAAGGSTGSSR